MEEFYKNSALMLASVYGHTEVAELLLQNGANIEMQDGLKRTALTMASKCGHLAVVKHMELKLFWKCKLKLRDCSNGSVF